MSPRSAADTALGVVGVYFVAGGIASSIFSLAMALQPSTQQPAQWATVNAAMLHVASGVALIACRHRLAAWLTRDSEPHADGDGSPGLHAAAISVLGVMMFSGALAAFITDGILFLSTRASGDFQFRSYQPFGELAVGLALFLGARGLVNVWRKLRTAGRPDGPDAG